MIDGEAPSDFIERITADLRSRLDEVDAERRAILRALKALSPKQGRRNIGSLRERVLGRLADAPGSRGSLVALELGVPAASVADALSQLEEAGEVAKVGLGWVTTAVPPTEG